MRCTILSLSALALGACGNFAPGPAIISLSPANPTTGDELSVVIDTDAFDPEGKGLSYSYAWYRDGEVVAEQTGETLSADLTSKGELWRVEVVANDGKADGPAIGAETTIGNSAPSVTVSINPDEPYSSDDLEAVTDASDPDGDTVSLIYTWTRDGTTTNHTGDTVYWSDTSRNQLWEVTVTPTDGNLEGEPATASVTVLNSPPEVTSAVLSPEPAYEDSVLRVEATFEDADTDSMSVVYAWFVDGTRTLEGSATTMSGAYFDKHSEVYVEVTPSDGIEQGDTVTTNTLTIANSPPSLASVSLDPSVIYESSVVSCVQSGLSDTDSDPITTTTTWTVNGSSAGSAETLDGSSFDRGDSISCTVTTHDGEESGDSRSSGSTTVLNTLPVIDSVSLSPSPIYEGDVVTASISGTTDDDGDSVSIDYAWFVNGAWISIDTGLPSTRFDKHDEIELQLTPNDGTDDGTMVSTGIVTVANTPPVFTTLDLSDDTPDFGGTITAIPSGWYDADGDSAGYLYAWYASGTVASTSATLDLSTVRLGSEIHVEVTANDGDDDGTTIVSDVMVLQHSMDASSSNAMLIGDAGELAGSAVDLGPDITGDGFGDLAIGAPYGALNGPDTGALYLISRPTGGTIDIGNTAVASLYSDGGSLAGWSLDFAGDVDGDGVDDLVVGAPGVAVFGTDAGAAYVLPGPVVGTGTLASAGYELLASSGGELAGTAMAGAGDLDDDGYQDFAVGAPGASSDEGLVYLFYGPVSGGGLLDGANVELEGASAGDELGVSVAGAGDFDGDGVDDVIIGALGDSGAGSSAGAAYLVYGAPSSGTISSVADLTVQGEHSFDYLGASVAGLGDFDGDGLSDVAIGSRWEDSGGSSAGAVYLVLGGASGTINASAADAKLLGTAESERAGGALESLSDYDGDGLGDFLVGAEGGASSGTDSGLVYMIQGPLTGTLDLDDAADLVVWGSGPGDKLGRAGGGGADVDADGWNDIILGAPYENSAGSAAGAAYLLLGSSF